MEYLSLEDIRARARLVSLPVFRPPQHSIGPGHSSPSWPSWGSVTHGPGACSGPTHLAVVALALCVLFRALLWGRLMFGLPGRGDHHAWAPLGYPCGCRLMNWWGRLMFGPPGKGDHSARTPSGYRAQHPASCSWSGWRWKTVRSRHLAGRLVGASDVWATRQRRPSCPDPMAIAPNTRLVVGGRWKAVRSRHLAGQI